ALFCAVTVDRQAIQLSEMQASFVANVSHQLRTPVAMLSAASETLGLERVRSPEKIREYAEIVRAQTVRLSGLVDQILHFAQAESRETAGYHLQRVDLGDVVRSTLEGFGTGRNGHVPIRLETTPDLPMVEADPFAIEQAIVNLLENAVKYGGEGNAIDVRLS